MADFNNNPFKDLERSLLEAPPHLKKKVMSDVATAKFIMDMASLLTLNYGSVLEGMFRTNKR
ncbi:MAG: hypothetical protein HKN89_10710 [Eudoraea sp.]|nr:hypothetical protein [Eudoraea sp.]